VLLLNTNREAFFCTRKRGRRGLRKPCSFYRYQQLNHYESVLGLTRYLLLLSLTTADLEVSQLVRVLAVGNNVQEITKLGLLQELLGQVLQVSLGERKLSRYRHLGLVRGDFDLASKLASLAVDLDAVVKELVEGVDIEHLIIHRLGAVNGELGNGLLSGSLNRLL
jgi:hypothetical protein